ncbi:histidine--tRNA ligase [Dictyobacter arantiisoli]|uniref:Histidine--tRNA ligase n=1 Tax=Dictyobacter arantiisoli TaxID=2014874 RepID=A0A5A5TG89_9CHLR|nr:histidine--tRNA ligase [Dictyobacter arantiisoli]GCF10590.1 histidine--tRNA ligase [Dictyobacter arantiisoli]
MPENYRALQGFKDILPEEQPYWRLIENTASEVASLYGYQRIETPLLEDTTVFRRTSGEGTDIVEHEMYSFDDRADKEGRRQNISLRPEGTASVVRAYLEHGMFKLAQPVKLFYMSMPMFRRERPQAGRLREHHQFGCEALGESDPAIDAEIIGMLYQIYTRLGLKNIRVNINSIGDSNCRPQYIEKLKAYYQPLLTDCCDDCQIRFHKNPLRLLDCKKPQDQAKIAAAPRITHNLCEPCQEHFASVQRYLKFYGVPYDIDTLIVRGLDYYTRTVFEFTSEIDNVALNGGGRYDGMAEIFGGPQTPGIGFGVGIERVILELKRQGIEPPAEPKPRAFVVYFGKTQDMKDAATQLTAELRQAGIKAATSYGERSNKAQMKQANASGAEFSIIIGEDELANGTLSIKQMQVGQEKTENKQVQIKRDEIIPYLTGHQA